MHQFRTHNCGELRAEDAGKTVRLAGWVFHKRDHGGILFIDLRDHYGRTQVVVHPSRKFFDACAETKLESVIIVTGEVVRREEAMVNSDIPTGEIELVAEEVVFESPAETTPIYLAGEADEVGPEDLRLKYRYLDLRRESLHRNIVLRSQVIAFLRQRMTELGFNEYQTPILTSSSPEGARDFLVPSRLHPGKFYALPQAPQQFKQLLMIAGFDRYFQIAPCFRDEDSRADRSPGEFYQLDIEMSFATQDDVFAVVEDVLLATFKKFGDKKLDDGPFPRIPYREAMDRYGSDKPDLRNPLFLIDLNDLFKDSAFKAFAATVERGGLVKGLRVPGVVGVQPRSWYDKLEAFAKENGAKGLGYVTWPKDGGALKGPIAKFMSEAEIEALKAQSGLEPGDALFFIADAKDAANRLGGLVRTEIANGLGLIDKDSFKFCWIVDFPMFETDPETGAVCFSHNPFSMPQGGMKALLEKDPLDVLAYQYDVVCNGIELSSGAVRNHQPDIMVKAFEIAGYDRSVVEGKFPALFNAFRYGAPPHAGVAPGVDRMVMLLAGAENIREIIAFPMNQRAEDLMMNAPQEVTEKQLREVHIKCRAQNVKPGEQQ